MKHTLQQKNFLLSIVLVGLSLIIAGYQVFSYFGLGYYKTTSDGIIPSAVMVLSVLLFPLSLSTWFESRKILYCSKKVYSESVVVSAIIFVFMVSYQNYTFMQWYFSFPLPPGIAKSYDPFPGFNPVTFPHYAAIHHYVLLGILLAVICCLVLALKLQIKAKANSFTSFVKSSKERLVSYTCAIVWLVLLIAVFIGFYKRHKLGEDLHQALLSSDERWPIAVLSKPYTGVNYRLPEYKAPLHLAAFAGLPNVIERLLQKGADINAKDCFGRTPIDRAVCWDAAIPVAKRKPVAKVLAKHGAKLSILSAAALGNEEELRRQLSLFPNDIDKPAGNGFTALHLAACNGHAGIVKMLLEAGLDPDVKTKHGVTPLRLACNKGYLAIVKLLMSKGAQVYAINTDWKPLHSAAFKGRKEICEYLLSRGADWAWQTKGGLNAMHLAAQGKHADVVALFLKHGAKHDVFTAAAHCDSSILRSILKADPQLINWRLPNGDSPLHWAVVSGNPENVLMLLKQGISPDERNDNGLTALHVAIMEEHPVIVEVLLKSGSNVNSQNKNGGSPVMCAVATNNNVLLKMLISYGARVNDRDDLMRVPLHYAASFGNKEVVELLLKNGANVHARDEGDGNTPLHLAARAGQQDTIEVLIKHGALKHTTNRFGEKPIDLAQKRYRDHVFGLLD